MHWSSPAACSTVIRLAPGWRYVPSTMTMTALWDEVGTPGTSATDTRAATAIWLTRALLGAVVRTSAATGLTFAWLGVARTSVAMDVTRFPAISALRPDLQGAVQPKLCLGRPR
jgi:hypothetical protein